MTKILIVSERFWPEGGGGTLATYLITRLLAECNDFKLTVVTGTPNPTKIDRVSFVIDKAFKISNKPTRWLYLLNPSVKKRYKGLMKKFDIIYIPYGYPLIPLAKELNKRVIVHLHDYQPIAYNSTIMHNQRNGLVYDIKTELAYELLEHNNIKRAIAGSLLVPITMLCRTWVSEADIIICVSRRQAEIISNRAPQLAHKIRVVYNPLPETPPIEEKLENPTFTYTGGGSYVKGFHIFIQASLNVLKQGNSASFMLVGEFRHQHINLLKKLNHTHTYVLLGYIPHEDALRLYSKSHAVLVPSICEEPLPYVVMEAMAMGTIPVASRIGGIPEIVKGTYAERMMFTPGDPEEMADKMGEVSSLPKDRLVDIGCQLRETVLKRFGRETVKWQLLKAFEV